jgi:hypothetical protein
MVFMLIVASHQLHRERVFTDERQLKRSWPILLNLTRPWNGVGDERKA